MLNSYASKLQIDAQNDIIPHKRDLYYITEHEGGSDSIKLPDRVAVFNEDHYISTMALKSYENLRSYRDFNDMIIKGITDYGMDLDNITVKEQTFENGGKFMKQIDFNDIVIRWNNDDFILRLWLWTGYNLKWAEQFIFGPIVVICTNGLYHGAWKIKGMSKKNWSNKAQLSAVDISTALEAFHKLPEVLEPMVRTTVSADNVKHLFENTIAQIKDEIYPRVSDYRMRELSTHWDMYKNRYGSNLWAVYQTATHWASHPEGRGLKANKIRTRSEQVSGMLESNDWNTLLAA